MKYKLTKNAKFYQVEIVKETGYTYVKTKRRGNKGYFNKKRCK